MDKIGFISPGQGSQTPGMGSGFANHEIAKKRFAQANAILGYDLQNLCFNGPRRCCIKIFWNRVPHFSCVLPNSYGI